MKKVYKYPEKEGAPRYRVLKKAIMFLGAPYVFSERLLVGVIKKRPNRFVMMVNVSGSLERVHCPCTGNIGNLDFEDSNIPYLCGIK